MRDIALIVDNRFCYQVHITHSNSLHHLHNYAGKSPLPALGHLCMCEKEVAQNVVILGFFCWGLKKTKDKAQKR